MRNDIPSLAVLQAFEASARLESFSRAGQELALTPSAVSRHVAALEARLGVALFMRARQRLVLTDTGRAYAARMRQHLEHIERDTQEIRNGLEQGYTLHLAVVSSFATQWLIPRLPDFAAQHPRVTVHLSVRSEPFAFEASGFDAAITYGDHCWPGAQGFEIVREGDSWPVCSPAYAKAHGLLEPTRHADGAAFSHLQHLHLHSRPQAWRDWYAAAGAHYTLHASRGPRYELFSMALAAASAGLGVAMAPQLLAQHAIDCGQLVRAARRPLAGGAAGYWFVQPQQRATSVALTALRNWLQTLPNAAGPAFHHAQNATAQTRSPIAP